MKRNRVLLILLVIILCFTVACSSQAPSQNKPQGKTITDSLNREINIGNPPQRIISLAPAVTEILFALGLDQQIVGVSNYCDYPEQTKNKEKMGGYDSPNVEAIASKKPDMVFISTGVQEGIVQQLEKFGITIVALDADTLEQVMKNIELAGLLTGKEKEAQQITADMKNKAAEISAKVEGLAKPKVFFEVWDDPLMSAGSQSFIHNMLETAGGINIAAVKSERYYTYSVEQLLKENPEVYIINNHSHTPEDIKNRTGYQALSAVQKDRVYAIDDNLISRPGPRVILGLEQIARAIHPEAFENE